MAAAPALVTYAHDFESTIQDYVADERQLLGILNFSALWHEKVYLNDVAVGDNPHLIRSFLDPARRQLYLAVVEFIRNDILRCHLRDKVVVRGTTVGRSDPFLGEIFDQWWTDGPRERFITQIFDSPRHEYNRAVDDWLKQYPNAVERYDPDKVKPQFRNTIRELVNKTDSGLRRLLKELPPGIESAYLKVCEGNEYFTNADLWRLYKGLPGSQDLVVAHGHINQQCCADLVHAGATGTRMSDLELQRFDWNIHVGAEFDIGIAPPKTFDEVKERADFVLSAPAVEILGLLTPNQVMLLREKAQNTIFRVAREAPTDLGIEKIPTDLAELPTFMQQLPIEKFRKKYENALKEYWLHVCHFLEREYPAQAIVKGRLAAITYEKLAEIPASLRNGVVDISLLAALNWLAPSGVGDILWKVVAAAKLTPTLGYYLGKLGYHILLERTPAMRELRELDPTLGWRPNGMFATNRWK